MRNIFRLSLFVFVVGLLSASASSAAVVLMETGERLIGEISEKSNASIVVLQSKLLGEISLPRSQIAKIESEALPENASPKNLASEEMPRNHSGPSVVETVTASNILVQARDLKAPDDWKGNLRFGLNLSQGDRKWTETYLRGNLVVEPQQSPNFYRYTTSYTYRETERPNGSVVISTDRYDGNFTFRRGINEVWFFQNSIGGRVDEVKGIERELQESVGIGYRLKPSEQFEFLLGGGGGIEDFETARGDARNGLNPVVNLFQEFTWRPFKKARFVQEFNYFVNPENSEQFNYLLRASFRYRITDLLGVEFSFDKNYDSITGEGSEQDDTRLRNAVIVYF